MLVFTVPGDHSRGVSICYAFLISNAGFNRSRRSLKEGNYLLRPSNQQCWFLPFQAKACGQQMLWFSRHVVRLERKVEVISAEGYLFRCSRYLFQPCLAAADDAAPAHHMHLLYSSFCSVWNIIHVFTHSTLRSSLTLRNSLRNRRCNF